MAAAGFAFRRVWSLVAVALALLGFAASAARANVFQELELLPSLDALNRTELPLSGGGDWSPLSWAANTGLDTTSGWAPTNAFPTVNGAFWAPATIVEKGGDAAALTMQTSPGIEGRYVSIWLGMPNPAVTKSGYQLRWTVNPGAATYTMKLSKWSSGTETVLASNPSLSIANGTRITLVDSGAAVEAFATSAGATTELLAASDATYGNGYVGIEASGSNSRSLNFSAGPLVGRTVGVIPIRDSFLRQEVPLASGKWSKSSWTAGIGGAWCCDAYHGFGSDGGLEGAYWNQGAFSSANDGGVVVAATVGTGSATAGEYQALWLNVPNPDTARSGYEARFTGVDGSAANYRLELSRWDAGARTVLASREGVSLAVGTTMALTESGGRIVVWTGATPADLVPLLSAVDSGYGSGYAGIDVNGGAGTDYNFRAGAVALTPMATTTTASAIKANGATLNGNVNPNGSATTYQFEYGKTTAYGSLAPASGGEAGSGSQSVPASASITGLEAGATYHYRIVATNGFGTVRGSDLTFTAVSAPLATTEAAGEVSAAEATLNASVNPRGGATTYQFEYGPTTAYGSKVPATAASAGSGTSAVAVSEKATGLSEGTIYHYRLVATNEAGTAFGADKTVTTPTLPDATTEAAERVNANEAILPAEVDPNGQATTYSFEYGTTPSYGSMAPSVGEEIGEAGEAENATDALEELKPETTYHYRVVANSSAGTVKGQDRIFTTGPPTMSSAEESVLAQEVQHYTGALDGHSLPGDYFGMMWSGDIDKTATAPMMRAVRHSGAKFLRLDLHPSLVPNAASAKLRRIVQEAAGRGITILPYFGWGWPDQKSVESKGVWTEYIKEMVETYGPNGSFWAEYQGTDKPMEVWEIGNEPNLGGNGPDKEKPLSRQEIEEYGGRFALASATAKSAAASKGGSIQILLSGLFSTSPTGCSEKNGKTECHTDVKDFIRKMGHDSSYSAISLHPYVLGLGKGNLAPTDSKADLNQVKEITHKKIVEARQALEEEGEGNKNVWITEIGWPTANQTSGVKPVTEAAQKALIESTFEMLKADHQVLHIAHVFYYNIQDNTKPAEPNVSERFNWDHFSGLRKAGGKRKPGWEGFANEAGGDPHWPKPTKVNKKSAENLKGKSGLLDALINTDGSGALTHFQYWKPAANPVVSDTPTVEIEGGEEDETLSAGVSGLQPETTYVYHPVVTNEEEETVVGENETFTTPPSTSTSSHVKRVLHGQPGYAWVEGWVKEGFIEGNGPGLANVHVHIKLFRNGVFQRFVDVTTDSQGHYESGYFEVEPGPWETRTEFPGGGEWLPSESPQTESFFVHDGVRIRAQHSGGCWDIFGAQQNNGAAVMHGACNEPVTLNQVFEEVPVEGGQYLQLVARHSGKCVDVDNASTADGSGLQQYDCLGAGQANQLFREAWSGEWLSFVAKHSNKCVDVTGASQGWINLQQWTCNASPQQAFRLEPVDTGPIPTESFLTVGPVLHGNGQFGNWGLATLSGHLLAGAYSMANRVVHIQVQKAVNGQWIQTDEFALSVNPDGSYRFNDYGLAPGIFRMQAVFSGSANGKFGRSESGWHQFAIWQANRIVSRNSDRCLSLSNAAHENFNGQHLIQWDCSPSPSFSDGQTFWFWPVGNNVYEITVIGTGKCLDVALGAENGARLQQWDCTHGANQKFQVLEIAGQPGWYAIRPTHQNRCLDVVNFGTGNGAEIDQWDCTWAPNQQWEIQGVIPG